MLEFKKAVYLVLSTDGTLTGLTTIHERAKLDEPTPFVDLADSLEIDWSTKSFTGAEYLIRMHIFADTTDIVLQIAERIRTLLHRQELTVTGKNFVDMHHEDTEILIDKDETTLHGIVSFRALVQG